MGSSIGVSDGYSLSKSGNKDPILSKKVEGMVLSAFFYGINKQVNDDTEALEDLLPNLDS